MYGQKSIFINYTMQILIEHSNIKKNIYINLNLTIFIQ